MPRNSASAAFREPQVGDRVEIFWEQDNAFYRGTLSESLDAAHQRFNIIYDDSETEDIRLSEERWRYVTRSNKKRTRSSSPERQPGTSSPATAKDTAADAAPADSAAAPPAQNQEPATRPVQPRSSPRNAARQSASASPTEAPAQPPASPPPAPKRRRQSSAPPASKPDAPGTKTGSGKEAAKPAAKRSPSPSANPSAAQKKSATNQANSAKPAASKTAPMKQTTLKLPAKQSTRKRVPSNSPPPKKASPSPDGQASNARSNTTKSSAGRSASTKPATNESSSNPRASPTRRSRRQRGSAPEPVEPEKQPTEQKETAEPQPRRRRRELKPPPTAPSETIDTAPNADSRRGVKKASPPAAGPVQEDEAQATETPAAATAPSNSAAQAGAVETKIPKAALQPQSQPAYPTRQAPTTQLVPQLATKPQTPSFVTTQASPHSQPGALTEAEQPAAQHRRHQEQASHGQSFQGQPNQSPTHPQQRQPALPVQHLSEAQAQALAHGQGQGQPTQQVHPSQQAMQSDMQGVTTRSRLSRLSAPQPSQRDPRAHLPIQVPAGASPPNAQVGLSGEKGRHAGANSTPTGMAVGEAVATPLSGGTGVAASGAGSASNFARQANISNGRPMQSAPILPATAGAAFVGFSTPSSGAGIGSVAHTPAIPAEGRDLPIHDMSRLTADISRVVREVSNIGQGVQLVGNDLPTQIHLVRADIASLREMVHSGFARVAQLFEQHMPSQPQPQPPTAEPEDHPSLAPAQQRQQPRIEKEELVQQAKKQKQQPRNQQKRQKRQHHAKETVNHTTCPTKSEVTAEHAGESSATPWNGPDVRGVVGRAVQAIEADIKPELRSSAMSTVEGELIEEEVLGEGGKEEPEHTSDCGVHQMHRFRQLSGHKPGRIHNLVVWQMTVCLLEVPHDNVGRIDANMWARNTSRDLFRKVAEQLNRYQSLDEAFGALERCLGKGGNRVEVGWFKWPHSSEELQKARTNYRAWAPPPVEDEWRDEVMLLKEIAKAYYAASDELFVHHADPEMQVAVSLAQKASKASAPEDQNHVGEAV